MTVDELREALKAQPFQAFTPRTLGGSSLPVNHPEMVALSPGGRTIAVFSTRDNAFEIVDTLMIESLVLGGGDSSGERRRSA
jgi:hypothetical protein